MPPGFAAWGLGLLAVLAGCSQEPPLPPGPATGGVTEDYLTQRHEYMLDTVVERPGRLEAWLEAERLREARRNRADFEQVMAEQQRLIEQLRMARARGSKEFDLLLKRLEYLNATLRRRGFATPRDREAFERILAEQQRILAELNRKKARDDEALERIQARQRQKRDEDFARLLQAQESFAKLRSEQERIEREQARMRPRDDQFFLNMQEEIRRFNERRRAQLEAEARFLERFGQPAPPSSR